MFIRGMDLLLVSLVICLFLTIVCSPDIFSLFILVLGKIYVYCDLAMPSLVSL